MKPEEMRYCSTGAVHLDFHGTLYATVRYLLDHFGEDALKEVLYETGTKVYRSIHERLVHGDPSELLEFWNYYFEREQAGFRIQEQTDGSIVLALTECPALRQLKKLGLPDDGSLCRATELLNQAFCSESPFEIVTECFPGTGCRQILRKRKEPAI